MTRPVLPKVPIICPCLTLAFTDVAFGQMQIFSRVGIVVLNEHIVTIKLIVAGFDNSAITRRLNGVPMAAT